MKELVFISYAGLIRGAVAFGLVLRIDKLIPNRDVIVTTSLALVVFSTVVFGSTVATMSHFLFRDEMAEKKRLFEELVRSGRFKEGDDINNMEYSESSPMKTVKKKKNNCVKRFKLFDTLFMKPSLCHNYDEDNQKKIMEFNMNLMAAGSL
jgi:NhaP-type Na+/H+ or K+/H+ antiporter